MKRNGEGTEYILRYLFALQSIAAYKADMMYYMTPYGLETRRQEAHDAMVEHVILPMLDTDDKAQVYVRTKDITDNLDKVWAIYDGSPFDLLDDAMVTPLEGDTVYVREDAFIKKAENFLEMLGYGFTITDNITHANYDKEQLIADFRNYIKEE